MSSKLHLVMMRMAGYGASFVALRHGRVSLLGLLSLWSVAIASDFQYQINTCKYPDGQITVYAKAYDAAGNVGISDPIVLNIKQAPIAVISYPADGAKVGGQVMITGNVKFVCQCAQTLSIDGKMVLNGPCGSVSYTWFATKAGKGTHAITLAAVDAAGNSVSYQILVKV